MLHPVDLELTAVFGMGGPRPEQDHRLIFQANKLPANWTPHRSGEQSACGELGSGIVNALYSSRSRAGLLSFLFGISRSSGENVSGTSSTKRQAACRSEQK